MIKLDFIFTGIKETVQFYDQMLARLADLSPAWVDIQKDFIASEKALFASEGGSGENGTWEDWSKDYIEWREWAHPESGMNKMILSGGLLDSLVGAGPGHVLQITPHEIRIGTDLPAKNGMSLGAILSQQHTAKYPYGNTSAQPAPIPGRKAIDPTSAEIDTWTRMVFSRILGEIV